jgi:hypothetical protein
MGGSGSGRTVMMVVWLILALVAVGGVYALVRPGGARRP